MSEPQAGMQPAPHIRGAYVEPVARHMFERQAATFNSDPALVELAWLDQDVRTFWIAEARSVLIYLSEIAA